ncbi:arsenate reductase ArsC [Oceaniferula spumae]|uniref:arsenate reductase ArsC n=1 Tax=Oceaniferula spumae TaxID=2979115 RepID=UPI003F4E7CD7
MTKPLILVLCTGNSCRSQMAEYLLRAAAGDVVEVASAGSDPAGYVHPLAIQAMSELGHDLTGAISKSLNEFKTQPVHVVISVCGNADQCCPDFPGEQAHYCWTFDDPAHAEGSDEEKLEQFRRIRDEIQRVFTAYGRGLADGLMGEKLVDCGC